MKRSTVSTRQPPAGGPGGASHPDALLRELRRGERDAFVRYFELFRAPVYGFTRRLLGDEAAAVAATTETFAVVLRRAVLDERAADLETLTYRCALDACVARAGAGGVPARPASETSGRFGAALDALDLRRRAALLLHDVHGLGAAGIAAVLSIDEEAAGALLFRAREEFRAAFDAAAARAEGRGCRQAEQAVAGAVGLGLAGDQLQRLRLHAAYCRPCRRAIRSWGAAPAGLAAVLEQAPLPEAL
ncbi:MAG: RNA polymerase sigma factor, partial [Deltaproteobacteria bacterium]